MRHVNIPVFIPHLGCPNQCVFCNQRTISGVKSFDSLSVVKTIDDALSTVDKEDFTEIAFFGGSFTGIDRALMTELLEIAYSYVKAGRVKSVRCSTRPDYIDEEIISILKKYSVNVVELGLQSTSDKVLSLTKRNHTFDDEERACRLITEAGIELVGQMMIGLPGSTPLDEIKTAEFIINSGASGARVYPTVVFRDTELCSMAMSGDYIPLSLEDAVRRSAEVVNLFRLSGLRVIRIGLQASEGLSSSDTYFAGPNHPSLGELVENKIYLDKITAELEKHTLSSDTKVYITVPSGDLSKALGQKKHNKNYLMERFNLKDMLFSTDESLGFGEMTVKVRKDI